VPAQLVQGWCTQQDLKCEKGVENQTKSSEAVDLKREYHQYK